MLKRKKIKTSPSDPTSRTLVKLSVVSIKEWTQKHQVTMGGERQYRWLLPLGKAKRKPGYSGSRLMKD